MMARTVAPGSATKPDFRLMLSPATRTNVAPFLTVSEPPLDGNEMDLFASISVKPPIVLEPWLVTRSSIFG